MNNQEQFFKKNEYYLLLDDYRFPFLIWWVNLPDRESKKWIIARHYYDFIHIIENNGLPEFISFDHDLDRQPLPIYTDTHPGKTGLHCAEWLVNFCEKHNLSLPQCAVHSTNPVDGPKIVNFLNDYLKTKNN